MDSKTSKLELIQGKIEDFWNELNEDLDFKELTNYKKVNYGKVFFYIISQLSKNFGNFIKEYNNTKKIIYKIKNYVYLLCFFKNIIIL